MKRNVLMVMVITIFMFTVFGITYAWQGRMDGMGNPSGLIPDESDFLINPARIADGHSGKIFNHYGFSYTGVNNSWDADSSRSLIPIGLSYNLENDGGVWWNEALIGVSHPLGSGKIAVFLEYEGNYGDLEGHEVLDLTSGSDFASIDLENDVNTDMSDVALRLVYGLPLGKVFKLGTEIKIAYRDEEAGWDQRLDDLVISGFPFSASGEASNLPTGLMRYILPPYDSDYWNLSFKLGLNWKVGEVVCDFAPRGGFIFAGDNEWASHLSGGGTDGVDTLNITNDFDMDGDVDGWNFGFDFWLRFPVTADTSMPLVFRLDYQEKERDGSGDGELGISSTFGPIGTGPYSFEHDSQENLLTITAGGGFDIGVSEHTKIAIGLFYNYMNSKNDLEMTLSPEGSGVDVITETGGYPEYSEHQSKLQLAGEHRASPCLTMRGGLSIFYGWVSEEYDFDGGVDISGLGSASSLINNGISLDGNRWGIEASLGASWVCDRVTIEPFINGGYQRVNLDGDEDWSLLGIDVLAFDVDKEKDEWFVGGGFSLLFNL